MKKKFSNMKQQTFMLCATLLALCFLGPSAEAQSQPILCLSPSEGAVFEACDAYSPPSFEWETEDTYKSLEIQFFMQNTSKTVKVKVPSPSEKRLQLTPSVWKKVFLLPGSTGGAVYWKVIGTRADRKKEESNSPSFQIGAPKAVQNPVLFPTDWSLPTLTWKTSCHSKITVWFGADGDFTKSKKFSFTGSIPPEREELFTYQLTSKDWNAIRNLVGHRSGTRIYWFVEAWDGLKRRGATDLMSFTLDISMDNLPPSIILDIPPLKTVPGFCYLESFSMQVSYLDDSVTIEEVFTFAGIGATLSYSSYGKAFSPFPGTDWTMSVHTRAIENYGMQFVVGHDVTGDDGDYLKGGAISRMTYSGHDEALNYLKALIHSGRPVQVHVDLFYLPSLKKYQVINPGASHFLTVHGYDSDSVYVTETYLVENDKDQFKNVRIPVQEFMEAWWAGGIPPLKGFWGTTGPYWMVFFVERESNQLNKASVTEILNMQRQLSAENESTIARHLKSDFSNTSWNRIALMKELFAGYLADNGYAAAASAYRQLAEEYRSCEGLSLDAKRQRLIDIIGPLETQARTLYWS